ncbi:unnamed protein product [Amoebophrya sp. A25]|nr:unnamed protein product [Amoebophrya sp. A25]|eukprot:GSA25T00010865001.1
MSTSNPLARGRETGRLDARYSVDEDTGAPADEEEQQVEKKIRREFLTMSILFGVIHATVTTPIGYATAALGAEVGSVGNGALYLCSIFSSLFLGAPMRAYFGTVNALCVGSLLYALYVSCFGLAVLSKDMNATPSRTPSTEEDDDESPWPLIFHTGGSVFGGLSVGGLWTAQGVFFADCVAAIVAVRLRRISARKASGSSLTGDEESADTTAGGEGRSRPSSRVVVDVVPKTNDHDHTQRSASSSDVAPSVSSELSGTFGSIYLFTEVLFKSTLTFFLKAFPKSGNQGVVGPGVVFLLYGVIALLCMVLMKLMLADTKADVASSGSESSKAPSSTVEPGQRQSQHVVGKSDASASDGPRNGPRRDGGVELSATSSSGTKTTAPTGVVKGDITITNSISAEDRQEASISCPSASSSRPDPDKNASQQQPTANSAAKNASSRVFTAIMLWRDRRLWLLGMLNFAFGVSVPFLNGWVNNYVTKQALGASMLPLLGSVTSIFATGFTLLYTRVPLFARSHWLPLGAASCCFALQSILVTAGILNTHSGWWLLILYILQGMGRAAYESTNKAVFADFFGAENKDGAFANVMMQNCTLTAFLFFFNAANADSEKGIELQKNVMGWGEFVLAALVLPGYFAASGRLCAVVGGPDQNGGTRQSLLERQ